MRTTTAVRCGLLLAALAAVPGSASAQCPTWRQGFGAPSGIAGHVEVVASFDDGSGPALYAAGMFTSVGSAAAQSIARWNGTSWSQVGGGIPGGTVLALHVFDDGSGPALFAGGNFILPTAGGPVAVHIAKWNGTTWSSVGSGMNGAVRALGSFDDGTGPALYAGGAFDFAGGLPASFIARWNGTSWSSVGGGVAGGAVNVFTVHDDGSGNALYAGGFFTSAGGTPANRIAKWNGSTWSALSSGTDGAVHALTAYDDGSGPALFVGGSFGTAGGTIAIHIAKWNGATFSSVGNANNSVFALAVHDDGSGSALYAGGYFTVIGGTTATFVARWNGTSWSSVGGGMAGNVVVGLVEHDDGSGPALYAAGGFLTSGGVITNGLAKWDGASWSALQVAGAVNQSVWSLKAHDDGSGTALYAGGNFTQAGTVFATRIARFDGTSWAPVGNNVVINNSVLALESFDDGSGTALYAGGMFDPPIAGTSSPNIARWNGTAWSSLTTGMNGAVKALTTFDDGTGPALYVGGQFTNAGGLPAARIARWTGAGWSALGSGMDGSPTVQVFALAGFDDGTGPALFAGGDFTSAGGAANTIFIAKWNGNAWSGLGFGMDGTVRALAVFDDGLGPALYAGGDFTTASGTPAGRIARWNGTSWSAVGGGMNASVRALQVLDDGSGPALFAGGDFTLAGGVAASRIARWNGTTWSALGAGIGGSVFALGSFDDGSDGAADLYVGGSFNTAGGQASINIAEWMACPVAQPYCFGDGSGTPCPCGNDSTPGDEAGCLSSILSGGKLTGHGAMRLSADHLVLDGTQMPNSSVLYFQGTAQLLGGSGMPFGDGLRCAGGNVVRLGTQANVGGASSFPAAGGAPISAQGHVLSPGTREYQVWYRNSAPFCTSATHNMTNAVRVSWVP